jgi:hypothetical protein
VRVIRGAVAALLLAGCANIGSPPGGPTRTAPPAIVSVSPDSGAVNVRAGEVTFAFDAVVSDRPAGAQSLEALFLISPRDGTPRVSWERSRIEVRPRRGFRPNTAYSVTLLPGVTDLRGNVSRETRTVVFSTGPTIPPYAIRGRAFDWISERPAANAFVEVIRLSDSLVYVGTADSLGQFAVGPLASGSYSARLILDNNRNRALDPNEAWDSVAVTVREVSPFIELLAAPRDTVGPRILTVQARDSISLVLNFDRPLDPAAPLSPESFRVQGADSTRLTVARVATRLPDAAPADSARRDSTGVPPPVVPAVPTPRVVVPRPSVPAPSAIVFLALDPATPLRAGASYRVSALNARGLLRAVRTSDRVITVERADSTRAPLPSPSTRPAP